MHHRLAIPSAKSLIERRAVVIGKVISHEGLAAVLVYPLQDLVGGGVAEAGEEGEEALEDGVAGVGFEDDGVELAGGGYARLVRH